MIVYSMKNIKNRKPQSQKGPKNAQTVSVSQILRRQVTACTELVNISHHQWSQTGLDSKCRLCPTLNSSSSYVLLHVPKTDLMA
jgi:hypothetical protein